MSKKSNWNAGETGLGDFPMKPFRDPITGKVVPQNPQGEASPVGSDATSKKNKDGLT